MINDTTRMNQDFKYVIASNLTSCTGAFAGTNLPTGWLVTTKTTDGKTSVRLAFQKGTTVILR